MGRRYLFGSVTTHFANQNLRRQRERGDCLAFDQAGATDLAIGPDDSWETVCAKLPAGWKPDFVVLHMGYTTAPECLWTAPVPLVGLAMDWNLLWHYARTTARRCDLVLTDPLGVELLSKQGISSVHHANLFGCERAFLDAPPEEPERSIDILFVGNLSPTTQRERLPWIERLTRLGKSWRVVIRMGVFGDDYRKLLRQARIVFNRSIRGECNLRVFEALSAGALLFQEAGNPGVAHHLREGHDYVSYTSGNLEELLEYYLTHEDERRAIAESGRRRAGEGTFESLWDGIVDRLEPQISELVGNPKERLALDPVDALLQRTWQALSSSHGTDPNLLVDLETALQERPGTPSIHNALGLTIVLANRAGGQTPSAAVTRAAWHFEQAFAAAPEHVVAGLNLAEALATLGKDASAIETARRVLATLDAHEHLDPSVSDAAHFPPNFDFFRVEWERAAWSNAGDPSGEEQAKIQLIRWRLHTLIAQLTGELFHHQEAALARPDLPVSRAALGCALARSGKVSEAVPHLRQALKSNPLDLQAAKALFQALGDSGSHVEQRRLAAERRLLARALPSVPGESWFLNAAPAGDELASLIIPCCNEVEYTRLCIDSVLRQTRAPYELILVDNGSSDGTADYLEDLRQRSGPERVVIVRNDTNRGFAAGCNQALAHARGDYVVFLNNDTVVTAGWLTHLIDWMLTDWPRVGLVGPTTNYAPPPQHVVGAYADLGELEAFAAKHRRQNAGKAIEVTRLTGFCLAVRREVLQQIGGFDERYGLGFFEDDDLCLRAAQAGFRLLVASDVFIHHFGSRTLNGLGVNGHEQLRKNLGQFRQKWGDEYASRYRLPAASRGGWRVAGGRRDEGRGLRDEKTGFPSSLVPHPSSLIAEPALCNGRMRVSLCMIVKNEEDNIAACLQSVTGVVDEMIVVDTGSTDRTKEIAAALGARVFDFPWPDSFSVARNESIRHATGDWIFWLDADDRVDEANRTKLRELFARLPHENVAYSMKCLCLPDTPGGAATIVDHVRLFRNRPDIRWEYRVHEQILPAIRRSGGETREADITIQHTGYQDTAWRQTKDHRNLRLLELDHADDPNNPFTVFNLGWTYEEMKRPAEALPLLKRSLELSMPSDSIVRKLYSLIMECHRQLGQPQEALQACLQGRRYYPNDAQLLFQEAILRREQGDRGGAEQCLLQLISTQEAPHFASVVEGLRGHKARHNLAVIYHEQGRSSEAEAQWQAAVREEPGFAPAWLGLGELYLSQGRLNELERVLGRLEGLETMGMVGPLVLRARLQMARGDFGDARDLLEEACTRYSSDVLCHVLLSHALLRQGTDFDSAERVLRRVLQLDDKNTEARNNLAVLLQKRAEESVPALAGAGVPDGERP